MSRNTSLVHVACAAFVAGAFAAVAFAGAISDAASPFHADNSGGLAELKARFRRPVGVPFPASNPYSDAKRGLGERLFNEVALSSSGQLACASCHQRKLGLADGRVRSLSAAGKPLARHTPTLWNLAWARDVFWDGRARSLEEQATSPIESPDEMAQPLTPLLARLAADPRYAQGFAHAFPADPRVTKKHLQQALATFVRTLVSPRTRFDAWIDGDSKALTSDEVAGFRLFTGRAGCANCHNGFAFTDYAFHDIGLPGDDRGRGAVLRLPAAEHAFKTPSLREVAHSAPYMHDGSLQRLEDVIRHYESGIAPRATLSADLPRKLSLADAQRQALIAFLGTLTSEAPDALPAPFVPMIFRDDTPAVSAHTATQHDKAFFPRHIALHARDRLWIVNNDTRTHNVRIFEDTLDFDSGAQEPGETIEIAFPEAGSFLVFCGIHPKMELRVDVAR